MGGEIKKKLGKNRWEKIGEKGKRKLSKELGKTESGKNCTSGALKPGVPARSGTIHPNRLRPRPAREQCELEKLKASHEKIQRNPLGPTIGGGIGTTKIAPTTKPLLGEPHPL